jgi:hypothetical protein
LPAVASFNLNAAFLNSDFLAARLLASANVIACQMPQKIFRILALLVVVSHDLTCASIAYGFPPSATAGDILATVDPKIGIDSGSCGTHPPCKTITHAIQVIRASGLTLATGVFSEPTINIRNISSLVIIGVPSATIFNCSDRLHASGTAFNIVNSTVAFTGVVFINCWNMNANGGALNSSGSSVVVSSCSFINCSAASGGAIFVQGPGSDLFLEVYDSYFTGNSAVGGDISCPYVTEQPCSTWGGAIATFEVANVTISGCTMADNIVRATVPQTSLQSNASKNAVAGGGCVSVAYLGNSSGTLLRFVGNSFSQCEVNVFGSDDIIIGNGMPKDYKFPFWTAVRLMVVRRVRWCSVRVLRSGCWYAVVGGDICACAALG